MKFIDFLKYIVHIKWCNPRAGSKTELLVEIWSLPVENENFEF